MRVNGTIHKRNFTGNDEWYFVEELTCDFFFGVCIPNDEYIRDKGKLIRPSEVKSWFTEGATVTGEPLWFNKEDKPWIQELTHINIEKLDLKGENKIN